MSKKEAIQVNDYYEYPKKSIISLDNKVLYKEMTVLYDNGFDIDKSLSPKNQLNTLYRYFEAIPKRIEEIIKRFLFLKLYKLSAKKDQNFNKDYLLIEKYLNRLKSEYLLVQKFFSHASKKEYLANDEINDMTEKVNYLYNFVKGLSEDLNEFQKKYYHEFKLSSYMIVQDKNIDEIEELIDRVNKEILRFKNIEEANDYFTYNSGKEITALIKEIVKHKKKSVSVDYHYYLSTDDVISFTYPEWVELFAKIRFINSKTDNKNNIVNDSLNKMYQELETRLSIILIYKEI